MLNGAMRMLERIATLGAVSNTTKEELLAEEWSKKLSSWFDGGGFDKVAAEYVGEKRDDPESKRKKALLFSALALGTGVALGLGGKKGVIQSIRSQQRDLVNSTAGLRNVGKQLQVTVDDLYAASRKKQDAIFSALDNDPVKKQIVKTHFNQVDGLLTKLIEKGSPEDKIFAQKMIDDLVPTDGIYKDIPKEALDRLQRKFTAPTGEDMVGGGRGRGRGR